MEEFKYISGFEGVYKINKYGDIVSLKNGATKTVAPHINNRNYKAVSLYYKGKYKKFLHHRLVAMAFIPNPENKPYINHINGIKTDNMIENLEWCTQLENNRHAISTGLYLYNGGLDKSRIQISADGFVLDEFKSQSEASRKTGLPVSNITNCINGKRKTAGGFIWK